MNLYERFARQARGRPDEAAIVDPDGEDVSYAELEARAGAIAHYLDDRTEQGDRVAVFMMDSPTYVAAVLGAWRAGCTVTPVNYRFGTDLVEHVFADVRPTVVLHDDVFATTATEAAENVDAVGQVAQTHADGEFATDAMGDSSEAPDPAVRFDDDTAVVMHTSGTTGEPKGVVQTHRNVGAQVDAGLGLYGVSAEDTAVVSVPLFHVGGLHGATLMALFVGGSVVVQPAWDATEWARLVDESAATFSGLVPAMIVDVLESDGTSEYDTSSLRLCFYGGAPAPEPVLTEFQDAFDVDSLVDYYGQTEASGLAVTYAADEERVPGAMGRAIPALESRVVDLDTGEEVDADERGELLLRGDTVMAGYWERPERNDETFTDGWLHTDDVVVRDEAGRLHYVDRVDDMILSGGEKVSPAAVENVISELDAVAEVAVLGTPHDRLGEQVTAAVVASGELTAEKVREHCEASESLAGYETPRRVEFVDEFPRTGSRKIEKGTLRDRLVTDQ